LGRSVESHMPDLDDGGRECAMNCPKRELFEIVDKQPSGSHSADHE